MNKAKWWKISNSLSLFFVVLIGWMWFYTTKKYNPNINQLTNQAEVDEYLSNKFPNLIQKRIPTGVFIQSLKFNSSTEVNLTGYIWQIYDRAKYKDTPDEKIPVGFILPEAVESNIEPQLTHREQIEANQEVIVWYFESTVKQKFHYEKYPFDHKTVWLRFWTPDFMRKTILVPSFASYKSTKLGDAFGYDLNIVLGQWDLLETFFDYRTEDYNTSFGIYEQGAQNNRPELYFNLIIERRFFNSFIVYILPLVIIAALAFATLMMITKDQEQGEKYGLNTSGVIGVCSGLFFLVLLSQVHIREQFAGSNIVYLEFFYPLMYTALLGVSVDSYLFFNKNVKNNPYLKWIDYEDNIIPKLLYWPFLLGSATIITAVVLLPESQTIQLMKSQHQSFLPDEQNSGQKMTFLPFNFDLESLNNPTKKNYQTLLPLSHFKPINSSFIFVAHQHQKSKQSYL